MLPFPWEKGTGKTNSTQMPRQTPAVPKPRPVPAIAQVPCVPADPRDSEPWKHKGRVLDSIPPDFPAPVYIGEFTDARQSYSVSLWRDSKGIFGDMRLVMDSDPPTSILYDPKIDNDSGAISFGARLFSQATTFDGHLRAGALRGRLKVFGKNETVTLARSKTDSEFPLKSRAELECHTVLWGRYRSGREYGIPSAGACPFERCRYGNWTAGEKVQLYDKYGGPLQKYIEKGQSFQALDGTIYAVGKRATVKRVAERDMGQGIKTGDTVYVLYPLGEVGVAVWHGNKVKTLSNAGSIEYETSIKRIPLYYTWWVQIRLKDGSEAWLRNPGKFDGMVLTADAASDSGPRPSPPAASPTPMALGQQTGYFTDGESNVRDAPSSAGRVLFQPADGARFSVLSTRGSWFQVRLDDGRTGWTHQQNIRLLPGKPAAAKSSSELSPAPSSSTASPARSLDADNFGPTVIDSYRQSNPPRYPRQALRRREQGEVVLRVLVGMDGRPVSVDVERSSRSRTLDRAAADAVKTWVFKPGLTNGTPANGYVLVPISFKLSE